METFLVNINKTGEYRDKFLVLIIYDIIDNRRRLKFCKYISKYATRVQKSCFETYLSSGELDKILKKVDKYIDIEIDNVRIYKLSIDGKVFNFGIQNPYAYEDTVII